MKLFCKFFLIFSVFGCDSNKSKVLINPFDNFVFSYSTEDLAYSIKLSHSDTLFLAINFPEPGNKYFSVINDKEKSILDSFLNANQLSKYDTTYIQEHLQDGIGYKFYLAKDTAINWIYMYGKEGPKELYRFANWLTNLKEQLKFYPYNGNVKFGDLKYIELPIVQLPPKENKNSR